MTEPVFRPSPAENEDVTVEFVDVGISIHQWTTYTYASNMEIPSDGWSFTLAGDNIPEEVAILKPGSIRVQLKVNGVVQGKGYIDSVEISASREGGTIFNVQGRDQLAQAVDACADPTKTFKEGVSLLDVLKELYGPFGWSKDEDFIIDNQANTLAKAGIRGVPHTQKKREPLKSFKQHQLRPYPREGVHQFASRIAKRHGLMIWQTAQGDKLVVSQPNFDTTPLYKLRRNNTGTTNVLSGSVKFDNKDQPTCIVADGASGGGEFGRGQMKAIMENTAVDTQFFRLQQDPAFLEPWARYPDADKVLGRKFDNPLRVAKARTIYLHDEESTKPEQLANFVRREMAHLQRQSLQVSYEVEGHGQITSLGFVPWTVDTTVDVEDDIAGLHERLYVLGRTFHKSRQGGTTTSLSLIRLHTIELGEPPVEKAVQAPKVVPDGAISLTKHLLEIR